MHKESAPETNSNAIRVSPAAQGPLDSVSPDLRGLDLEPSRRRPGLLLEGSLAGVFGCHETALELVSGADFFVQIDVPGKPRRSRGVPGSIFGLKPRKTGPKIFCQTAFRYPGCGPRRGRAATREGRREGPRGPFKGPRGPLKGPRGPFKGPRGPFRGPRCPFKGPRRPSTGDRRPSTGDRRPPTVDRRPPTVDRRPST